MENQTGKNLIAKAWTILDSMRMIFLVSGSSTLWPPPCAWKGGWQLDQIPRGCDFRRHASHAISCRHEKRDDNVYLASNNVCIPTTSRTAWYCAS
jgi:hypothetical protein